MNIKNIFSALLGFSLMFSACTSEEVDVVSPSTNTPGVHLRLTGAAAAKATSRATVAAEDGEKSVNNLLAVLFDTHEGFYKTVPATRIGDTNEYTFIVEKDATYDIWLVANASDELKTALENIPAGTPSENSETGENCLNSIIADQAPDAEANFLMVSKYSEKITTRITESQSIGEVHMIRLAARFDLLNKAENVTVTSISFANRTVKSAVLTPNTASTIADWYETKEYEVNVAGDPENGAEWNGHIYTYENNALEGSFMIPELIISYYEGENSSDIKTHKVKLIDTNSTTGATLPVKRNNLYRIVLTKATKLDCNLQVLDWDDEEAEIKHTEVPLILPKNVQDSLNQQLLVYNLFSEYYVKSIDYDNHTVEFNDNYAYDPKVMTKEMYFSYNELKNKGLTDPDAILTNDGVNYRLPTAGELKLLACDGPNISSSGLSEWPVFSLASSQLNEEIQEYVYLKNQVDNKLDTTHDIATENEYGFTGSSQLKRGKVNTFLTYDDNNIFTVNPNDIKNTYNVAPVYGIRFKGTKQFAAYKWENIYLNNNINNRGISIKIKAIPKDADVTLNDIIDNQSYWTDGYIELIFPFYGYYSTNNGEDNYIGVTQQASIITSTCHTTNNQFLRFLTGFTQAGMTTGGTNLGHLLRLVKIKELSKNE